MESGYVKASVKSEIPVGKMKAVKLGDKEVLIANVNGTYYAINNRCTRSISEIRIRNVELVSSINSLKGSKKRGRGYSYMFTDSPEVTIAYARITAPHFFLHDG